MAPAALRSGWVGAITQATTCLKIIDAFRAFLRKTGADPNLKLEKVVSDLAGMIGKVLGIQ